MTFDPGSYEFTLTATESLRRAASAIRSHPDHRVSIAGHADAAEGPEVLALSSFRARAVRDALVGLGVPAQRLVVFAYGDDRPRGDSRTPEGQADNRGVDVILHPPSPARAPDARLVVPIYGATGFMPLAGFGPGSSVIPPPMRPLLEGVAEVLLAQPWLKVEVQGHADRSEPGADRLSERRARAAMMHLVELGVPEERLTAKGYGTTVDVVEADATGPSRNRAVGFRITAGEIED